LIGEDEYLERIVAGIQAATTDGADVTWNEIIDGRQFDAVVRFTLGTLQYLVLIEVKNRMRRASASELEAFVTKTRDHQANKAVFVTAAGFQSGAIKVAKRHGVDLFTVVFDEDDLHLSDKSSQLLLTKKGAKDDESPVIEIGKPTLTANIEDVVLKYASGKSVKMPNEPSQMTYYAKKTKLEDGRVIDQVVQQANFTGIELGKERIEKIPIVPAQRIYPPDNYFFPSGVLASLWCTVVGRMGRPIRGNTLVDPGTFSSSIIYTNVLTGEVTRMTMDQLPLGGSRAEAGKFYFIPHPLIYFYCEAVYDGVVYWNLIESFQNGELLTASTSQDIKYSVYYVPVTDKKTLKRLRKRLRDYKGRISGRKKR